MVSGVYGQGYSLDGCRMLEDILFMCSHLPPVTVKQLLVENGAVGTKEGYRVKVGGVNRILKS